MTREDAMKKAMILDFQGGYAVELITKIYDELKLMTCENCKHHSEIGKSFKRCNILNISTSKDFGCSEYKRKTDENK